MYCRAFINKLKMHLDHRETMNKNNIKSMVLYGVKYITTKERALELEQLQFDHDVISSINSFIPRLTYGDFMKAFPITKEYKGEKWGTKDYFYVMDYINKQGVDSVIGENATELLWEYDNLDVRLYVMKTMTTISDIRRLQGKKGLMEEFAEQNGIETYTLYKDGDKEYMMDNKGRTYKVNTKKRRKSHLKLVK